MVTHTHTHTYTHTYIHTHTHTYIHIHIYTHTYIYTYTHTHIHIHTHNRNIWPTATQYKHMAQPHAHSQPIETYGLAHTIETYGHTIAGRRRRRHAWPILLFFNCQYTHYSHVFLLLFFIFFNVLYP